MLSIALNRLPVRLPDVLHSFASPVFVVAGGLG